MKFRELLILLVISLLLLPLAVAGESGTTLVIPPWNHCLGLHKVGQFHLNIYSGYREKFDDPQGLYCVKLICEDDPETKKDDDELTVYGLNSGKHKIIYNKSLTSIGIVGGRGNGPLQFSRPQALTGDREGNLFVADTGNDRVVHLKYENDELHPVKEITAPRETPLDAPSGICLSGGQIYTADTNNDRIVVFNMEGSLIDVFMPELNGSRLFRPYSIAVVSRSDDWFYYGDQYMAVVDSLGERLWKISPDGTAIKLVRYSDLGRDGRYNHIAIDFYGNIYVTDAGNGLIHKFDRHLNYIVAIGERENGKSQFDEPRGIAINRRFGQIFVSEKSGAQYYWIGTDMLRLKGDRLAFDTKGKKLGVDVSFLLTEHSEVSLYLEDEDGNRHHTFLNDYLLPAGKFERRIEIQCDGIQTLAKCKPHLVAIVKPTYSSRAFLTITRESFPLELTVKSITSSVLE